jgi:Secretion system C-terminal sorting domain
MKTTYRFFLILALLSTSFRLTAHPDNDAGEMLVKIKKSSALSFTLQLANLQNQLTEVKLVDVNGKDWYIETLQRERGYIKTLNLSKVPEGIYILTIENNGQKYMQAINKDENDFAFFEDASDNKTSDALALLTSSTSKKEIGLITKIKVAQPFHVSISLANLLNKNGLVQLNSLGGDCLMKDKVENVHGYAKLVNVLGMNTGTYYFLIRTEGSVQIQFFTLTKNGVILLDRLIMERMNGPLDISL